MRGYGESDLPPSTECYKLDCLVTDIKDIVEYLGKTSELCFISLSFLLLKNIILIQMAYRGPVKGCCGKCDKQCSLH